MKKMIAHETTEKNRRMHRTTLTTMPAWSIREKTDSFIHYLLYVSINLKKFDLKSQIKNISLCAVSHLYSI